VARDLKSNDGQIVARAWRELERRRRESGLSESTEWHVAEAALAEQAKPTRSTGPLLEPMLAYLSRRCADRKLSAGQQDRFFRQALRAELKVRPVVVAGERVHLSTTYTGNGVNDPHWVTERGFGRVTVGPVTVESGVGFPESGLRADGVIGSSSAIASGVGPQPVTFTLPITIYQRTTGSDKFRKVLAKFEQVLRGTTLIEEKPSASNPKMVPDPALAEGIRAATSIHIQRRGKSSVPAIHVQFRSPPENVAFAVSVRIDGKEVSLEGDRNWPRNFVSCGKGKSDGEWVFWDDLDRITATRADVILRASGRAARATVDLFEIWDGELIFKDVPIRAPEGG
jgi:hypothetical protein